jgi:G3E family GTPase
MNIKTHIEIVTGFLGSGKTTFINSLLENTLVPGEKVIVVQQENGNSSINVKSDSKAKVITKQYDLSKKLTSAYLKQMICFYNPHRIIIEYNGMKMLGEILNVLEDKSLEELCTVPAIYNIIDGITFEVFFNNMKELLLPCINHSNLIVVNNCIFLEGVQKKRIVKELENINKNAFILCTDDISGFNHRLKESDHILSSGLFKSLRIKFSNKFRRR